VHFINQETCPGIKKGGSLNIVLHTIEMKVPADAIPDGVTFDLATAEINDSIHISAIKLPEGCKPVTAGDFTVATIAPPAKADETPAAAAAAAAAPAAAKAPAKDAKK
jgi:large subunit ribosomal protein L25